MIDMKLLPEFVWFEKCREKAIEQISNALAAAPLSNACVASEEVHTACQKAEKLLATVFSEMPEAPDPIITIVQSEIRMEFRFKSKYDRTVIIGVPIRKKRKPYIYRKQWCKGPHRPTCGCNWMTTYDQEKLIPIISWMVGMTELPWIEA